MSLVIPQITFPLLGALAIEQLLNDQSPKEILWKKFRLGVFITGALFAMLILFYFTADYKSKNDAQMKSSFMQQIAQGQQPTPQVQQQATEIITAIQEDRKSLFGGDLLRSMILVGLTVVLIGAYLKNKLKPVPLMVGLLVLLEDQAI